MVTYPVGLGDNTIRILVTDDYGPESVVMATYTVSMYRESRPSLPMFGEHAVCSFLQVSPQQVVWRCCRERGLDQLMPSGRREIPTFLLHGERPQEVMVRREEDEGRRPPVCRRCTLSL